jgi:hypothetical protein
MSEILVEDGTTYPASVVVPEDGDARNAASVVVGFQALANRCAYFLGKLGALISGGSVSLPDDLEFLIAAGKKFRIATTATGIVDLTNIFGVHFSQNAIGALFAAGSSGRPNRRATSFAPGAGTLDIDVSNYDTIYLTPSAGCSVRIAPTIAAVNGDWVEFINESTANSVQVLNPASGVPVGDVSPLRSAAGNFRSAIYVCVSGVWKMASAAPYTAP